MPRIEVGQFLRAKGLASAMIDLSDGLSTDLAHICEESGVGAEIHADRVPRATIGRPVREVDLKFALHGGEDYELLFTAPGNKRVPAQIAGVAITQIGHITRGKNVVLMNSEGAGVKFRPQGWEHFKSQLGRKPKAASLSCYFTYPARPLRHVSRDSATGLECPYGPSTCHLCSLGRACA